MIRLRLPAGSLAIATNIKAKMMSRAPGNWT